MLRVVPQFRAMAADDPRKSLKKAEFNREAWRAGLDKLPPEARAAMAAVSAEKERPGLADIDRMVAGLGAADEIEDDGR
jgi:hypothetical protein